MAAASHSACLQLEGAWQTLLDHTDICSSVLVCRHETVASISRQLSKCSLPPQPEVIRRVQSLFGSIRRMYEPLLTLHPSVSLDLRSLFMHSKRLPGAQTLDIVISRCHEPLWPALRVFPAALPPSMRLRARVIVYEHCTPGDHLETLPALDVRDSMLSIRHIAFRSELGGRRGSNGYTNETAFAFAAFGAYILGQQRASDRHPAADRSLFLLPAGVRALASQEASMGPHGVERGVKRMPEASAADDSADPVVKSQRGLQRSLRQEWSRIATTVEEWTRADGGAAALSSCIMQALSRLDLAPSDGRSSTASSSAATPSVTASDPPQSRSDVFALRERRGALLGVATTRRVLSSAAQGGGSSAAKEWDRLLSRGSLLRCKPRRAQAGKLCNQNAPAPGPTPLSKGHWPANVSLTGFCGVTNEGVEGSCERGDSGSWNTRVHRVRSFSDCVGRCTLCARCAYVTYSPDNDDCSWYSYRACNLHALGKDDAFQTVMVVQHSGGTGNRGVGGIASAARTGSVAGQPLVHAAHVDYTCALRADRKWGRELLRGALLLLVSTAVDEHRESRGIARSGQRGAVTRAEGRTPLIHPSCVPSDFMLHNRQLLPLHTTSGVAHPCQWVSGSALPSPRLQQSSTSKLAHRSRSAHPSPRHPLSSSLMSYEQALEALDDLISSAAASAVSAGCSPDYGTRMELHLS